MKYVKAYWRYLHTSKGRHDFCDYAQAGVLIAISIAVVLWLTEMVCER